MERMASPLSPLAGAAMGQLGYPSTLPSARDHPAFPAARKSRLNRTVRYGTEGADTLSRCVHARAGRPYSPFHEETRVSDTLALADDSLSARQRHVLDAALALLVEGGDNLTMTGV